MARSTVHTIMRCADSLALKLRRLFFCVQRLKFKSVGKGIEIYGTFVCHAPHNVVLGDHVSINDYVYINGAGGVIIGDNVALSAGCKIISTKLDSSCFVDKRKYINEKIVIGNNVQIGANAVVLPGVTICDNVIVGAGAIVTKSIKKEGVYIGTPAICLRPF